MEIKRNRPVSDDEGNLEKSNDDNNDKRQKVSRWYLAVGDERGGEHGGGSQTVFYFPDRTAITEMFLNNKKNIIIKDFSVSPESKNEINIINHRTMLIPVNKL